MSEKFDLYEHVTGLILAEMAKGNIPWIKPWAGKDAIPRNWISKRPYNGMNALLLYLMPYGCPFYATYRQIQTMGASVKSGEKAHIVVYWNFSKVFDKELGKEKTIPFLKYYYVFNLEQTTAEWNRETPKNDFHPIAEAEKVFTNYTERESIPVIYGGNGAFYSPSADNIHLPLRESFVTSEHFYATAFHESAHSTGHKKRLAREDMAKIAAMGDASYSREELTAELASAFLCAHCGIDNTNLIRNSAAYIENWSRKMREDKRLIVTASGKAAKAVSFILGERSDTEE